MKGLKANIDNKNILEDFIEDFHGGRYIERITENLTHQVFIWKAVYVKYPTDLDRTGLCAV